MKISVHAEEGFITVIPQTLCVYIDGVDTGVVRADIQAGWADVYKLDVYGKKYIGEDGEPEIERVYGIITIGKWNG